MNEVWAVGDTDRPTAPRLLPGSADREGVQVTVLVICGTAAGVVASLARGGSRRLAFAAVAMPSQLGAGRFKQCRRRRECHDP